MSTLLGNPVQLTVTVTNPAGAATDPATLTLSIYRPDGATDTVNIGGLTHTGTGSYTYSYLPQVSGQHDWSAVATVPSYSTDGSFTVTALPGGSAGRLNSGYLTGPEFRNMATFLELDNLVQGGSQGQQSAELANELRRASAWADQYVGNGPNGPTLGAKVRTEQLRARVDRDGMINLRPRATSGGIPVRQIVSLSYGATPLTQTSLTDLSGLWLDGSTVSLPLGSWSGSWSGSLNIGRSTWGADLFVALTYVSGWPNTIITADAAVNDTTITVADPTGIRAGDVLDLIDPGDPASANTSSEQVTVAAVSSNTITLTTGLIHSHLAANEIGISALPADVKKAVSFVARSFLSRRGPEKAKSSFGGSRLATGTKTPTDEVLATDDYLNSAAAILDAYRRKTP